MGQFRPVTTGQTPGAFPRNSGDPHIGMVTAQDSHDVRVWSGTTYHMAQALARQVGEVSNLGPVEWRGLRAVHRILRVQQAVTGWRFQPALSPLAVRGNAARIARRQRVARAEILFAPAGGALIPGLRHGVPVAYSSDATARLLHGYYDSHPYAGRGFARANALEGQAIRRADLLIYPSEWAAQSAITHYGADPVKVHVVPYGANLARVPSRAAALRARGGDLRLLFVGADWHRKGGDVVVATLAALRARGIAAQLDVVGCAPPEGVLLSGVPLSCLHVHPFLDKSDPAQARQLEALYLNADILVQPSRAECYGIVFAEAAAHGVPSFASCTGGISGAMRDGKSGFLLPRDADGPAYAGRIAALLAEPGGLSVMRRSARDEYEARFNWDHWAARVVTIFRHHLEKEGDASP